MCADTAVCRGAASVKSCAATRSTNATSSLIPPAAGSSPWPPSTNESRARVAQKRHALGPRGLKSSVPMEQIIKVIRAAAAAMRGCSRSRLSRLSSVAADGHPAFVTIRFAIKGLLTCHEIHHLCFLRSRSSPSTFPRLQVRKRNRARLRRRRRSPGRRRLKAKAEERSRRLRPSLPSRSAKKRRSSSASATTAMRTPGRDLIGADRYVRQARRFLPGHRGIDQVSPSKQQSAIKTVRSGCQQLTTRSGCDSEAAT